MIPNFEVKVRAAYEKAIAEGRANADGTPPRSNGTEAEQDLGYILRQLWSIDMHGFIPMVRSFIENQ